VRGGLVAGDWAYLYRAVDSTGKTIEFMLSPTRDLIAAKLFYALLYSVAGPHRGSSMSMDIQPTPARSPS
jgi:transposase-like protein